MVEKSVRLADGTLVPALGQGTWCMGEDPAREREELAALRRGIELGMTLIDTAEMYGDGGAERLIGKALAGMRDHVFLVSKVYPFNAGGKELVSSCENSLRRLNTDHLDLYLLHWRGQVPLRETIAGMERLIDSGKIRRWGVSNLDVADMTELFDTSGGRNCAVNQVLYHLGSRGIEHDLLPWQRRQGMPVMAYSPLAQAGRMLRGMLENSTLREIAARHDADPLQVMLAWCLHHEDLLVIPKASTPEHVSVNAAATQIRLEAEDWRLLDQAFPAPGHKVPLDII